MATRKRTCEESVSSSLQKVTKSDEVCVIHFNNSNCESYTYFAECKGPESRLEKLQDIGRKRLAQSGDSPHRLEDSCKLLPKELKPEHGYHRDCYQRFTKNLDRLKISETTQPQTRTSGRTSLTSETVIFKPDCIFCNKEGKKNIKVQGIRKLEGTRLFDREGGLTLVDVAEAKKDDKLLIRIRGFDLDMAGMSRGNELETHHRDLRPTEVTRSERSVVRALAAVESFTNPFEVHDKEQLIILSSGATVPGEIEKDVLRAEAAGNNQKEKFITERLETREHFFDPVKRLNLKTMGDTSRKVKLKSTQNKVTEYKHQGNVAFQLLVKSQEGDLSMNLKQLLSFQLTPVPYSLGTADGYLAKTDKSTGFHYLTKDVEGADFPPVDDTLMIIDGNATFHAMQQVPPNFRQICQKLYDMVPPAVDFVFSTDMYQDCSVKSMERNRRGSGDKIILKGDSTKRPADWKAFLTNDEYKVQFIRLLKDVWSKDSLAEKLSGRNVVLICEGKAFKLTSADGRQTDREELHSLSSTQEETDSRVILYSKYGQDQGYKYIRVKSPDTDVFFILLNFATQLDGVTILFDTGRGNNKRLIDISDLARGLTQPFCAALLSLHAFTGCDSTSAFKGKGKVKAVKALQQKPAFVQTFAQLGDSWEVKEEVIDELETFTCCMYGRSRFNKIDDLRHHMLKEKCGDKIVSASNNVDLGTLPPCRRSLKQHVHRCNYQVAIWKRGDQAVPDVPPPTEGHGWTRNDGVVEPLWTQEEEELTLPQAVIDELLNDVLDSEEEEVDGQNGITDSMDSSSDDYE